MASSPPSHMMASRSRSLHNLLPPGTVILSLVVIYFSTLAPGFTSANDGSDGGSAGVRYRSRGVTDFRHRFILAGRRVRSIRVWVGLSNLVTGSDHGGLWLAGTAPRGRRSLLGQVPEQVRAQIEKMLSAITPRKACPVCDHRDEMTRHTLQVLMDELRTPEMVNALQDSDGLCLPHLHLALERVRDVAVCEMLLSIHREKLESLRAELDEFIRKNDYRFSGEGFGKEGDAWLRAIGMVVGRRE